MINQLCPLVIGAQESLGSLVAFRFSNSAFGITLQYQNHRQCQEPLVHLLSGVSYPFMREGRGKGVQRSLLFFPHPLPPSLFLSE